MRMIGSVPELVIYITRYGSTGVLGTQGRGAWARETVPARLWLEFVDLQDLMAVVIDDLHGDLAGLRRIDGAAARRVQGEPREFIDVGP